MRKITCFLLTIISAFCCFFAACSFDTEYTGSQTSQTPKTDEEKIIATINKFTDEYNDGNFEGVLECMEATTRNAMSALFNLLGGLIGGKLGVDVNLADLFSLGVSLEDGDYINFDVQDIAIGNGKATVTAFMNLAPATATTMYIILLEEDGEWLIQDITDKKPLISSGEDGYITSLDTDGFLDGYLFVAYEREGTKYSGIMNTQGQLIYEINSGYGYQHLGNGMFCYKLDNQETGETEYNLMNSQGETVATSAELGFELVIGGANGCAWVYKSENGINGSKYWYNCVDSNGKYKGEWFDLQIPYNVWNSEYTIVNDDILIAELGWDMAMFNVNTQEVVWLRDMGEIHVYDGDIYCKGGAYHTDIDEAWDRVNGVEFPKYYRIKPDGSIEDLYNEAYEDAFKEGEFTGGKLIYEHHEYDRETEIETDHVLIYDLLTGKAVKYTDYPTDMVVSVEFASGYGLVQFEGKDYNAYFTVIDENGVQQFEPIMCYAVSYSEGMIRYATSYSGNHIVIDAQGNVVVPESAGYYVGAFKNGLAIAHIEETQKWLVIDKQGNVVFDSVQLSQ